MDKERFEMWARVDLFGHTKRCGKLSVVNTGVEVIYRLDSPAADGFVTEYFGKGAVYSIMPITEEAARLIAVSISTPAPMSQWDLPAALQRAIRELKQKQLPEKTTAGDAVKAPDGFLRDEERLMQEADDHEDDRDDFDDSEDD